MRTREYARTGLAIVAWLFAACLVIQIFLAGLGVFDDPRSFITHREFGYAIGWFILALVVLAIVGRVPRGLIGLCLLTGLQMILQSVFVAMRASNPTIAALHPVNGVLMLIVVLVIGRRAWALRSAPAPAPASAVSSADVSSGSTA